MSVDPVEGEPPYQYVRGNPANRTDPSGFAPNCQDSKCKIEIFSSDVGGTPFGRHLFIVHTDEGGNEWSIQGLPETGPANYVQKYFEYLSHDNNAPPSASPWGQLQVHEFSGFVPGVTRDTIGFRGGPVVLKEGIEACSVKECLRREAMIINDFNLPYWPHDQNSNRSARTLLRRCNLPEEKPWGIHPGWGDILKQIPIEPTPTPTPGEPSLPTSPPPTSTPAPT